MYSVWTIGSVPVGRHDAAVQRWQGLYRLVLEKHHQNTMATRHIAIETWLEALGMMDYYECFAAYNGVEELLNLSEAEVRDLGLRNPAHRAKIVSSLRILREKYEKGSHQGKKVHGQSAYTRNQNVTAQLSWSPPSLINSPDYQVVNVSPEKLQQDLLVELQGDPADLKSKAWYHGSVSRQRAESLVSRNGDFLVRDCISKPGDFVLTCCWKGGPLHFVINSTVIDQGPNKLPLVVYHFENLKFNGVQELMQFYMDECKQITEISGAVITTPIARSMPLQYYDSKYGALAQVTSGSHYSPVAKRNSMLSNSPQTTPGVSPRGSPISSPHGTPGGSPRGGSPAGSPRTGSPRTGRYGRVERSGSQPLLSLDNIPGGTTSIDRSGSMPAMAGIYKQVTPTQEGPRSLELDTGIYKQVTPTASPQSRPPPMIQTPPAQSQARPPPVYIHQRSGSAPLLTPGVTVTQHFDYLAPPKTLTPASSDSDLHKAPPPKPSRIPSVKYKKKPQVVIRNVQLYEDDDNRDYSDLNQVESEPSWLKKTNANNQYAGFNKNVDSRLYDNNVQSSSTNHDVNQNIPPKDNRKVSDTRYSLLDGHDYSDIPAFPLELNLKKHNNSSNVDSQLKPIQHSNVKIPDIKTEASFDLQSFTSVLLPNENKLLEPSVLLKMRQAILMTDAPTLARHLTCVDLDILQVTNTEDLGMQITSGLELMTLPQGKQLRQDLLERMYCLKAFVMVMILTCPKVVDRAAVLSQWIQVAMETNVALGNLFGFENIMAGLMSDQIIRLRDTWMVLRQNHTNSAFLFDTKLKPTYRSLQDGSNTLPVQDISVPGIAQIVKLLEMTLDNLADQNTNIADINNDLDVMLIQLDMARIITAQCGVYQVVGQSHRQKLTPDTEKSDMFRTEFQMRFLWGSKGAGVNRTERHNKFTMLLKAYSEKLEQEGDDGTAV